MRSLTRSDARCRSREGSRRPARWIRRPGLGRRLREKRGQAIVEFLITIPALLLLVVGILEFGTAWRTNQVLTNTAREGARIAVLPAPAGSEANAMDAINTRLASGGLDPDQADVQILCENGTGSDCFGPGRGGNATEVRIEYPYTFIFLGPVAGLWGGSGGDQYGTVTIRARIVMRNE
jgi:hypothetical protein